MIKAQSTGDKTFDIANYTIMTIILIIILYPLYLIVISSISDPNAVNAGEIWLYPKGFTLDGYIRIYENEILWRGYRNSLMYSVLDVSLSLCLTLTAGYALSRKDLIGANIVMMGIVFTMFFHGGLIPTYLLVKDLGMVNTIWAMFVPSAVQVFHIIITRTFFATTIPEELLEAAHMDGSSNIGFFFKIVLPLSLPIIAVMALFNAVQQWNSFFPALIYLRDEALYPLQLVLRDILISNQASGEMEAMDPELVAEQQKMHDLIKYGIIIVASIPMLILYPFLQKYFVKGVMIGSVKG